MRDLQTLVVATDLSPASAPALRLAADLARRTGADLHILYAQIVFRMDLGLKDGPHTLQRVRVETFVAQSLGLSRDALDAMGPTVAVASGTSAQSVILDYAEASGADLLVVGTHGRTGVGRLLLGSVAEACVVRAPCAVLTVPSGAMGVAPGPEAPIIVPIEFSSTSERPLAVARALSAETGAPIELVHVVRTAGPYPDLVPDYFSVVDYDPEEDARVRQRLEQFGGEAHPRAVHALMGDPSRVIPHFADSIGAGMVVMGTHGRRGLGRAVLGSVAQATLRRATCPVLTIKAADLAPTTICPVGTLPSLLS
ncbi:universal stress protein [Rubricoccus marinus]|uniref:UspA domain-containing protein n=1 Tax=Rubricoccus marinus TaxID=716817 RepID=A0A259TXM6_9BACT|nr:universal stress protein [Rubricoccus marinus]OZC02450.1 hypothetical protein BSZ36_05340 [Rubricoccus marinus]